MEDTAPTNGPENDEVIENDEVVDETAEDEAPDEEASEDTDEQPKPGSTTKGFKAITSQEALNKIVQTRLARATKDADTKIAELQAKADKWDQHNDANKTDEDRARERDERFTALEAENKSLKVANLRREIADEIEGFPAKLAKFITGDTREEMETSANELLEALPGEKKAPAPKAPATNQPKPDSESRHSPDESTDFDPKAVVKSISR